MNHDVLIAHDRARTDPARKVRSVVVHGVVYAAAALGLAWVLYGFEWNDLLRVGVLVVFALFMWRMAIHAMERKLID